MSCLLHLLLSLSDLEKVSAYNFSFSIHKIEVVERVRHFTKAHFISVLEFQSGLYSTSLIRLDLPYLNPLLWNVAEDVGLRTNSYMPYAKLKIYFSKKGGNGNAFQFVVRALKLFHFYSYKTSKNREIYIWLRCSPLVYFFIFKTD